MQRNNTSWTVKQLVRFIDQKRVTLDNPIQRGSVWDVYRKSLLIHSILYGYPIPALYFLRTKIGVESNGSPSYNYDNFDGKQRSLALYDYIKGNFKLVDHKDIEPIANDEGEMENIRGLYFSELPEWAQDRIKDYSLSIYYFEDMTETEIREYFRRLNNGKLLSSIEITRVQTPNLSVFQRLAHHGAIDFATTGSAKKGFMDENTAMQIYNIVAEQMPDFSTNTFRAWAKEVKPDETVISDIFIALDFMYELLTSITDKQLLKTIKKRTHFVAATYACYYALKNEIPKDFTFRALATFFANPTDEYSKSAGAGSAKATNVVIRKEIMEELIEGKYNESFSINGDSGNIPEEENEPGGILEDENEPDVNAEESGNIISEEGESQTNASLTEKVLERYYANS